MRKHKVGDRVLVKLSGGSCALTMKFAGSLLHMEINHEAGHEHAEVLSLM